MTTNHHTKLQNPDTVDINTFNAIFSDLDSAISANASAGSGLAVTNSSGAAALAGDVGYLDAMGEYQTTSTEGDIVAWVVVVTGGADTAEITVARRGIYTVNYENSTSPSKGDYLITSTTAGKAVQSTTMRPEMFAICKADGVDDGSGLRGTVEVILYTQTTTVLATSANFILSLDNHSTTGFVSTISGTPTTTSVVYGTVTAGDENVIADIDSTALGKVRLWNTTRSSYRLIESVDTATNTITTVASTDSWASGDSITIQSQTTDQGIGTSDVYFEVDLSEQSTIPTLARGISFVAQYRDSAAANEFVVYHPFETFSASKQIQLRTQVANVAIFTEYQLPLINRVFCMRATASGAGTITLNDTTLTSYAIASP